MYHDCFNSFGSAISNCFTMFIIVTKYKNGLWPDYVSHGN